MIGSQWYLRSVALLSVALTGCSQEMPILNPNGSLAEQKYTLLVIATCVMLLIVIPLIVATLVIVWRYREANAAQDYDPNFTSSRALGAVVIFAPLITVVTLGSMVWVSTHKLDPYRPFISNEPPLEIQAIGLDYKWLFIYPDAEVATVNDFVVPAGRAVTIRLTSDPMVTAIFVPGLLSQIYAMPGMETRSNFLADRPGESFGANAKYSGEGFSHQRFKARVIDAGAFNQWTAKAKTSPEQLDKLGYDKLWERSDGYPVTTYGKVVPDLFSDIVKKYSPDYRQNPLPIATAGDMPMASTTLPTSAEKNHKGH